MNVFAAFFSGINIMFTAIYNIAVYAACAYSLYVIAKRNNVSNPWIAFVPILQYYIIGSLCEEYELFGIRIKRLEIVMCVLAFVQVLAGFSTVFGAGVIDFAVGILIALIMHKFFYLFDPSTATVFAILCMLGRIPLAIILFVTKDKPIQMSAGAYRYPFADRR